MIAAKRIAVVQVARQQLRLSEEDYRGVLQQCGNVASAKDLDDAGFERVMDRLGALGFRSTWKRRHYGNRLGRASTRQVALIRHLWREWADAEKDAALDHWLEGSFKVSSLRFLTPDRAQRVIEALKAMTARKPSQDLTEAASPVASAEISS